MNTKPTCEARFSSGQDATRISTQLVLIPAAPQPAMARPRIRARELEDTVQIREPRAKMAMARLKLCFTEKRV